MGLRSHNTKKYLDTIVEFFLRKMSDKKYTPQDVLKYNKPTESKCYTMRKWWNNNDKFIVNLIIFPQF